MVHLKKTFKINGQQKVLTQNFEVVMNLILVSGWPVHDLAAVVSGVGGSNPVNEEVLVLNRDSSEQRS